MKAWQSFETQLAPFAVKSSISKGRRHAEPEDPNRSPFARDRDRIVHATSFRRLEYKTQVFVNHEGDLFRTRLTHSMEVAQIARTLARNLRLNEDLIEAIALSHDLGHTPFGHAGQDALNECMRPFGGFEHNLQSLRIVDELEERYGAFNGLNLTFETREGILKHCSAANAPKLGDVGERFIRGEQPSLEAQLTNIADAIAYSNHDIDDGLRSKILTIEGMREVPIFVRSHDEVRAQYPNLRGHREVLETVRRMISVMVSDLTQMTQHRIQVLGIKHVADVRLAPPLAGFSDEIKEQMKALKSYLFANLYRQYQVLRMSRKAQTIIQDLFDVFMQDPRLLPPDYQVDKNNDQAEWHQARRVADYIAGMTDRYAMKEHRRIFALGAME